MQTADGVVEISWTSMLDGKSFGPYFLVLDQLQRATARMREALDNVQAAMLDGRTISGPEPLQELARNGLDLYGVIMTCSPRHPAGQAASVEFRDWFESTVLPSDEEDWRIEVLVQDITDVMPWGLVFSPNSEISIDDLGTSYEDYQGFWCNRFRAATFHGLPSSTILKRALNSDRFKISLIVEKEEQSGLLKMESSLQIEQSRSHDLLQERMFEERDDASDFLLDHPERHHVVYMSLLVDGESNDHGSLRSLRDMIEGNLYVFLDGDAVIRGDRQEEWLFTLFKSGWSGLIAAETDITNQHLKFAGWDFLKEVLTYAQPLGHSIHEARRSFWPGSILYGVYSDPMKLSLDERPPADFKDLDAVLTLFRDKFRGNAEE